MIEIRIRAQVRDACQIRDACADHRAAALAAKLTGAPDEKIHQAYRTLYGRNATNEELALGKEFTASGDWRAYAQVLLSANELLFVN